MANAFLRPGGREKGIGKNNSCVLKTKGCLAYPPPFFYIYICKKEGTKHKERIRGVCSVFIKVVQHIFDLDLAFFAESAYVRNAYDYSPATALFQISLSFRLSLFFLAYTIYIADCIRTYDLIRFLKKVLI